MSGAVHLTPSFILVIAERTVQGGHKYLAFQQTCKDPAPEFSCKFCGRSSREKKKKKKAGFCPSPYCIQELIFIPSPSKDLHTLRSFYLIPQILVVTSTELMQKKASCPVCIQTNAFFAERGINCEKLVSFNWFCYLWTGTPHLQMWVCWHKTSELVWSMCMWIYPWTFLTRWTKDVTP